MAFVAIALIVLLLPVVAVLNPHWVVWVLKKFYPAAIFHLNDHAKVVAITIDDGPDPASTAKIAQLLHDAEISATFFFIGSMLEVHPKIAEVPAELGHAVGVHFFEDEITALRSQDELGQSLDRTLRAMPANCVPTFVRPGFGVPSRAILRAISERDLRCLVGDIPAFDVTSLPDWMVLGYIRLTVRSGSIVTFHEGVGRGSRTLKVLPLVIKDLRARGFQIVSLDEGLRE